MSHLLRALNDLPALAYTVDSLRITLREIDHSKLLVDSLVETLGRLRDSDASRHDGIVGEFCGQFSSELDCIYRGRYEAHRKEFFYRYVFPTIPRCDHIVDLGCGRGWVSKWLHDMDVAKQVTGIDPVDFGSDWAQVRASNGSGIEFSHVAIADQEAWFAAAGPISAVLCSWMFHHSTDAELALSFRALSRDLRPGSHLIVLEDAMDLTASPDENNAGLFEKWCALGLSQGRIYTEQQFNAQVILDFVAVRMLARYSAVDMDFNYKPVQKWAESIAQYGFVMKAKKYIGFPKFRDIAVPQTVMVFLKTDE